MTKLREPLTVEHVLSQVINKLEEENKTLEEENKTLEAENKKLDKLLSESLDMCNDF